MYLGDYANLTQVLLYCLLMLLRDRQHRQNTAFKDENTGK